MIPVALVFLALVDGALLGFRAGAGRVGLVDKSAHVRRAVRLGLLASAIVALVGVALALGITAFSSRTGGHDSSREGGPRSTSSVSSLR
jgi:hypothetical protein